MAYKQIHAAKLDKPLQHRHTASLPPQSVDLLQAALVEHARAVEHHWGRTKEERPLRPRDVSSPDRFLEPLACRVVRGDEGHVDDADDERRDRDEEGDEETPEEVHLFLAAHQARTVFERWRVVDGRLEGRRAPFCALYRSHYGANRELRRRGRVGYGEYGIRVRSETFDDSDVGFQRL